MKINDFDINLDYLERPTKTARKFYDLDGFLSCILNCGECMNRGKNGLGRTTPVHALVRLRYENENH